MEKVETDQYEKAFRRFAKTVKKRQRIINTKEWEIVPRSEGQGFGSQMAAVGKPNGLWYSCGSDWLDWCLSEQFGFGPCVHEIKLDMTKIKLIKNVDEFDAFSEEFGISRAKHYVEMFGSDSKSVDLDETLLNMNWYGIKFKPDYINWTAVAERWAGIEINPYLWKRRLDGGMWYYGWDCGSGIVWDKEAVKSVELIAYYDEKVKKVVRV